MNINKKVIKILPKLLTKLSNGESLHLPTLSISLDIPKNTLVKHFTKVLRPIFPEAICYDNSTKNWYSSKNFLSETLLTAEELVTMKLLENYSLGVSDSFASSSKRIFNRFRKQASLKIFKKVNIEKITKKEESSFVLIEYAIMKKQALKCNYRKKNRIIYPLKIVMLEGYWYLFLLENNMEEVRKYHLKSIRKLELMDIIFTAPKKDILDGLKNAINAYFNSSNSLYIELLVHKKVAIYLKRKPLSPLQYMEIEDENYFKLSIKITDEREIIPTIQQYLPYIKVISPDSLHQKIEENINNYNSLYLK